MTTLIPTTLMPWKRTEARNGMLPAPISRMRSDWDRLFDRVLDDVWSPAQTQVSGMVLDISETDDLIRVRVEVPGIDPEALDISLSGDVLTLSAEKTDIIESKETRCYSERTYGSYERSVKLPCPVDPEHVTAEHKHGVVTITLEKAQAVRPKRIKVKSA